MGIPEFWGQIIKNREGVDIKVLPGHLIYSLALDLPGIIHAAAQEVWLYGNHGLKPNELKEAREKLALEDANIVRKRFYARVTEKVEQLVAAYQPYLLIIAIDGRSPVAKIQEQRKRRYKNRQLDKEGYLRFDNVQISVGTDLMIGLHEYILEWIKEAQMPKIEEITGSEENAKKISRASLPRYVIYSSYLYPGEAEHKIMDIYKLSNFYDIAPHDRSSGIYYNILYGKDADLILLSLINPIDNIIVVRENYSNMVNIEGLKKYLQEEDVDFMDYVIMITFVGNDFLPKQPVFRQMKLGITRMLDIYKILRTEIKSSRSSQEGLPGSIFSDDKGIIWYYMAILLKRFVGDEDDIGILYNDMVEGHIEATIRQDKMDKGKIENKFNKHYESPLIEESLIGEGDNVRFSSKTFRKKWYDNALLYKGKLIHRIKSISKDATVKDEAVEDEALKRKKIRMMNSGKYTNEDIQHMCEAYLIMFSWVYRYYNDGQPDVDLYYPFHHAPLLEDLVDYLAPDSVFGTEEWEEYIEEIDGNANIISRDSKGESGDYHMLQQLLAIVPPTSKAVLPEKLQIYLETLSGISDMYPTSVLLDKDGSDTEYTYNCLVPFADMMRIKEATDTRISKLQGDQWDETNVIQIFENKMHATIKRSEWYYKARGMEKKENRSTSTGRRRVESETPSFRGRGRGRSYERGRGRGRERGRESSEESDKGKEPETPSHRGRGRGRGRGRKVRESSGSSEGKS